MTNLSNTNTSTSIVKYIVNNSKEVILRLILVLTLVLILILLKNNPIIDTIVVNEYLVWNTNTHMVFKSYTPLWVSMRVSGLGLDYE
jgi:hypothetical protein